MRLTTTDASPFEIRDSRDLGSNKPVDTPPVPNAALCMNLVLRRYRSDTGKDRFVASARLPLPGRDIHAAAVHADLHTAIVQLIGRLARRSRKGKTHPRKLRAPGGAYKVLGAPRDSSPHVVVAIDLENPAEEVTRAGVALAAKIGARLTLLHVLEPVNHTSDIGAYWSDYPDQRRHQALLRLESWSRRKAGKVNVECRVAEGRPWEEVVRFAAANNANLIVMGRSETRWFGQLTVRTVERVVQHSPCPVLMVGQNQQRGSRELQRVLLTTDFSEVSLEAFPWAERIARWYGAEILMGMVHDPLGLPGTLEYARFHPEIDDMREQADSKLERWRKAHLAADLCVETRVMEGEPAPSLCRLAEMSQTDLIIMSTGGAKGWVRKWLGGTTEKVLRNATCSVLVVPRRQSLKTRPGLNATAAPAPTASWNTPWTAWGDFEAT